MIAVAKCNWYTLICIDISWKIFLKFDLTFEVQWKTSDQFKINDVYLFNSCIFCCNDWWLKKWLKLSMSDKCEIFYIPHWYNPARLLGPEEIFATEIVRPGQNCTNSWVSRWRPGSSRKARLESSATLVLERLWNSVWLRHYYVIQSHLL